MLTPLHRCSITSPWIGKQKNNCSMKLSLECVAFNCEPVRKQNIVSKTALSNIPENARVQWSVRT